ncbi:MAG: DEAD/DEAH box helicase family protein [Sporocytophaga sp.]|uniref:type I restriction endonuclease subunit R n=1 Tax=Sporocytophaga sp. TaxID=2231183 RepID=UPI001B24EA3E|nr:DEAD/DEAH box helicase family protein [Sporocytophaga sp.]MBO9703656.1 DEAD/DEAH box helicase family protein [Sporocytophaga sp.]
MKNEKLTRKEIIDNRLKKAGWNVFDRTQVIEEFFISPDLNIVNDPPAKYSSEFSDYVLLGKDGKPLAVVEAKKSSVDARVGEEQAKQYAYNIQKQFKCELPFCMYTNGNDIYFWDLENYSPRKIYAFPTRSDLERMVFIRKNRKPLADELINTSIAGRPYQIQAIRAVFEAMEQKKRKFLLIMATGTGKTRTCIAMVDGLMRAGWVSRILFLVDRIALRDQAVEAFKENAPQYSVWPQTGETKFAADRRVYVSTYPTMLNIIEDEKGNLSPHFFDLIVIDESHRSIYNVYQNVLNYFNTIVLGLTATPTDAVDHNTFELFDCEDGLPTFAYTFEDAVNNKPPYLSNFEVMQLTTKFQQEGIHVHSISEEDQRKLIAEGKDPVEINFEGTEIEKAVTNKGTNALIVREFWEECIKDPNGVLPGKTIFFCMTMTHARRIKEIFDQYYPQGAGEIAKVIVSDDPRVYGKGGLLDQFKNNDFPRIAISVDMLDTGIDIPQLVNLVFAKPVFSYTKFWQMIGRGTRVLNTNDRRSWCHEKDKFLIIDCWNNFTRFKLNPKGKENKSQLALPVRLFKMRLEKLRIARKRNTDIANGEKLELEKLINALPQNNVVVLDNASELDKVYDPSFWDPFTEDKIHFLDQTIAPILRALSSIDFKAMRFEKDIVEFSIAQLENESQSLENLRELIITQIAELPINIGVVAKEKELIKRALRSNFWTNTLENDLKLVIEKIAPLMRYRQSFDGGDEQTSLNLRDVTYKKEMIEFGPENELVSISRYKEMVENMVQQLVNNNQVLQKIKLGESITDQELGELAQLMNERDLFVTEKLLQRVYGNQHARFLQFIKHILQVEPIHSFEETVTMVFDDFIKMHNNLSSNQIEFLNLLKTYLIDKGSVQKKDLINPPFTQLHPQGILGVFSPKEIEEIIGVIQQIAA